MTYAEKLKNPKWQKLRLEVFQRDNFTCQRCIETERTLHVHHNFYIKGREPWEYPIESLSTICDHCHDYEHQYREGCEKNIVDALRQKGLEYIELQMIAQAFVNMTKEEINRWAIDSNTEDQVFSHCDPVPNQIEGLIVA